MKIQKIQNLDIFGKKVLLRVDVNVPISELGQIADNTRIQATVTTIRYLLSQNCSIVIMSHLGRPKGKHNKVYSLAPVHKAFEVFLERKILFVSDILAPETDIITKNLLPGNIVLLENLRFYEGEENNDEIFAKKLASFGEIYINDAFGVCHRKHASVAAITHFYDKKYKGAGFLLQREVDYFHTNVESPNRPFLGIVGGSKVSSKLASIDRLIEKTDFLFIGGGMVFTFLKAQGYEIGKSLCEENMLEEATKLLKKAEQLGKNILFPVDFIVSDTFGENGEIQEVSYTDIPNDTMALDIGSRTLKELETIVSQANTIFWNGPMGVYEMPSFAKGSLALVQILADCGKEVFVGGGDSLAVIGKTTLASHFDFLSTGGGASLELIEGKKLPGIESLKI